MRSYRLGVVPLLVALLALPVPSSARGPDAGPPLADEASIENARAAPSLESLELTALNFDAVAFELGVPAAPAPVSLVERIVASRPVHVVTVARQLARPSPDTRTPAEPERLLTPNRIVLQLRS